MSREGEGNTESRVIASGSRPRGVREPGHAWNFPAREPGDPMPAHAWRVGRSRKAKGRTLDMNGHGESDRPVVLAKPPNKAESKAAEVVEGRGLANGNANRKAAVRTLSRGTATIDRGAYERQRKSTPHRHHRRQEPSAVVPHAGICAGGPG